VDGRGAADQLKFCFKKRFEPPFLHVACLLLFEFLDDGKLVAKKWER
jgi:hypothetical protein